MNDTYKINGKIIFNAYEKSITPSDSEGERPPRDSLRINIPASRCFSLLIENKGKIVSREKFINEVWRKNGIEVSMNTFYQNISILRRHIKQAGIHEEIIITVPKKGLTLSNSVLIEKIEKNPKKSAPPLPLKENKKLLTVSVFFKVTLTSIILSILIYTFITIDL